MDQSYSSIKPNQEILTYEPTADEKKTKIGKYTIRRLFEGELDEQDNAAINKFLEEAGPFQNPIWTRPQILRFLQANNFKKDQTIQTMQQYEEWVKTLPISFDQQVEQFLKAGIIYIQGRDHSYRPIIVLNAYKVNFNEMSLEQYLKGLTYFLQVVVNDMMVPGRVENWVILIDLDYKGMIGLQINALKQVMSYLQNNYRSRLYRMFIFNTTMMLNVTWNMAKLFLEEITQQKIIFVKGDVKQLFQSVNQEQIEQRFGGTQTNRVEFWPPSIVSANFRKNA
ncbi:unnamed protein product [Paramecium octaurelia]|uniref:CRAL-TRIO domain-containing protein n=1 Tax=Paramecium octaurelia TaxID=43137 RepID=A0A8S1VEL7_PAROT|nr:unnamed protein product [Paramecium octaurelia]